MAKMVVLSTNSQFSPHFRNKALQDLRQAVPWARNSEFKALDGIIATPSRNKSRMYGPIEGKKRPDNLAKDVRSIRNQVIAPAR